MSRTVRRSTLLALATLGAAGCLGDFRLTDDGGARDGGHLGAGHDGGIGSSSDPLRTQFQQSVWPILSADCNACHGRDGGAGPAFLKPEPYDTLIAYPGIVVADASTSRLLTKGAHAGPAFSTGDAATVLAWLVAEAATLPPPGLSSAPTTTAARPQAGSNSIDLSTVSASLAGASIDFDASYVGNSLILENLTLKGGAATGVRVVHPLFIVWSGGTKTPDPVDSFATLDETVSAGDAQPLGPGTLILNHVAALDELSIAFTAITAMATADDGGAGDDGGVVAGGCKAVAAFTADAQPTLAARCVTCHGGNNAMAQNALDMSNVPDGSQQSSACAQVKNKINPQAPSMSLLLTVTDPKGGATHPFKFPDSTTFGAWSQTATKWITQEK